jgi:putative nucleotidyltransferase with HDIG domain
VIAPDRILSRLRSLPTLSATAVRLSALARDERSSAADFEKAIRPDPALTANLLRIVNAAYFGLRARVDSVRQAVTLLGLRRTSEVAAAAALGPIIPRRLPGYEIDASSFWQHCIAVAVLSERLSAELRVRRPDLIFTAGLLHDLGKLAIGAFVAEASGEILLRVRQGGISFASAERAALGVDHAEVGAALAEWWKLPPAVADVSRWHHAPAEAPETADRLLVDLVHVADALAHSLGMGADVGEMARKVDAATEARLGIRSRRLEHVAGESLEQIRELERQFAPAGAGGTR